MKHHLLWLILILLGTSLLEAQNQRLFIQSPRSMGMGGAGIAVLNPEQVFFYNPAQLNRVRHGAMTILDTRIVFNQHLWEQYKFFSENQETFKNLGDFSDDKTTEFFRDAVKIAQGKALVNLSGPVPINIIMHNFAGGFFTNFDVGYQLHPGASGIPIVDVIVQGDFLLQGSAAFGFKQIPFVPGRLSIGASVKYLNRWVATKVQTATDLNDEFPIYFGKTISADLGVLYNPTKRLYFGFTLFDMISPDYAFSTGTTSSAKTFQYFIPPDGKVEPSLRLGVAYYPKFQITPFFRNFILAMDYDQPLDGDITFFKKLYLGIEGSLTSLLQIRAGVAQGYPTFGFGIWLGIIQLDYAFYGEEWGYYAGQHPNYNQLFRVKLGF
ncbi:conjugal transfer protein TraF [candidate division KSB1 bacterium]|nr:conjugal transfer protein TraF [candidate division KSB1 bacterium]